MSMYMIATSLKGVYCRNRWLGNSPKDVGPIYVVCLAKIWPLANSNWIPNIKSVEMSVTIFKIKFPSCEVPYKDYSI